MKEFYCALCGLKLIKPTHNKIGQIFFYPEEMLCDEHCILVDYIMDEFERINRRSDWKIAESWEEFVYENYHILIPKNNKKWYQFWK